MGKRVSETWAARIMDGDRIALAQAITLAESSMNTDRREALSMLALLGKESDNSIRLAVTGPPGAGKSSLIEALGLEFIRLGHRVGVLSIDPSSPKTGGSILGDKTRMPILSSQHDAFVRPSPSSRASGGVAPHTRDCISVMEAAGFDIVIVETVGVGQSEYAVTDMTDVALLVMVPGTGDSLQAHKRGILEMVDMVVINKCDGANEPAAELMRLETEQALILRTSGADGDQIRVGCCSAVERRGIKELAEACLGLIRSRTEAGSFSRRRKQQAHEWLSNELEKISGVEINHIRHAMDSFRSGLMNEYQALAYVLAGQ